MFKPVTAFRHATTRMPEPLAVPSALPPLPGAPVFACSLCGDCCRDLRVRKGAPDWPGSFTRTAARGYYGLPTEGGLQVWAWEKPRFEREAAVNGLVARFEPSVIVADDAHGRLVTLVYELAHDTCPFLGPGPTDGTLVCGAYDARPLACRAFPVVMTGGVPSASAACRDAFPILGNARSDFAGAYGDAFAAAEDGPRVTRDVHALLGALEHAGALRLARGLEKEQVLMRRRHQVLVDLCDVLAESPLVERPAWWPVPPAAAAPDTALT